MTGASTDVHQLRGGAKPPQDSQLSSMEADT